MATKKAAEATKATKYVVVRGSIATVAGYLESVKGTQVVLTQARMIGYWENRHMLTTLVNRGPDPEAIYLADAVSRMTILDATTILEPPADAAKLFREIPTFEAPEKEKKED